MNRIYKYFYNNVKAKKLDVIADAGLSVCNEELWHKYIIRQTNSNLGYLALLIICMIYVVLQWVNII